MTNYYALKAASNVEEYIKISSGLEMLKIACLKSEFQYLNKKPMEIGISEDSGIEFPDYIRHDGIPLISNKLKQLFDNSQIDNLFYKRIDIVSNLLGKHEVYWLALPPRIDCVDMDRSSFQDNWEPDDSMLPLRTASRICISERMVGNYQIFMVAGVLDNNIYITESLKKIIDSSQLEGIDCFKIIQN